MTIANLVYRAATDSNFEFNLRKDFEETLTQAGINISSIDADSFKNFLATHPSFQGFLFTEGSDILTSGWGSPI